MESKEDTDALVSSSTWLQCHGLRKTKLTLQKILAQLGFEHKEEYVNKLGRPVSSRYAHGLFHQYNNDGKIYNLTAKREHVLQKIESVTRVIELFKQRLIWLAGGSRVLFGIIQEQSVAFVIDVNSLYEAQDDVCREAFCLALNEQVAHISKFNLVWASEIPVKWQRKPVSASYQTVEAATQWVWNQPYSPTDRADCAAEALSLALNDQVEAIYYFSAGDIPDDKKLLMSQRISNSQFPIHVVSCNPLKPETITFWKELSHQSHGRFHVYSVENKHTVTKTTKEEYFDESNPVMEKVLPECDLKEDQQLILDELKEAQSILEKLKDILKTFYDSENENSSQPTQEENPEDCISSKIWLQKYGLKAKKLQFYDALADCAFRHIDGVVDIKTKPEDESIQTDAENQMKLINAKYCERFVHALWKDGSVVHVFVSKEKCRWYEERMRSTLELMERRVKWLQNGSRELFGTILEDQIYILIDTSHSMKDKLFLVKEKLFQLMQEQLKYKQMFNFIKFDSKAEAWKTKLADVNENSLKEAWLWVKELQVGISTNTLEALQIALRDSNTQAVYLLTDGRPDQPSTTILKQVNLLNRVPIHTISFNCDDTEANGFLHQLSSKTGGRFHSYSSDLENPDAPQPFVSEDIQLLLNEIEMGKSDLEKMQKVHTECLLLDVYHNGEKDHLHVSRPYKSYNQKLLGGPQSACECATTSPLLHTPRPNLLQRNKAHHAAQTRSSLLRALSNGVKFGENLTNADMPLERKDLFLRNDMKAAAVIKDFKMADDAKPQKKVRRLPKDNLDISSAHWLKKRGLVARKLTIMDVLAPTTVPHTAKYVPILDKHVLSKVFDEALPLAHVSGSKKLITLINPQAVNLQEYKQKLARAIDYYERRLNLGIWRALSQEERDRFESDAPVPYLENKEALLQALDRLGWPIPIDDVMLLEEEIETGKRYLQQASDLQDTSKNDALAASLQKSKNKEENKNQDTKMEQRKKAIDTLKNQKVIARSDVDGFYYQGSVVRSISKKHALVDFCQGENQIIPITFIIPTGGAVPNPPLKVGDFVFSKTSTGSGCYVPAVVIATPRTEAADKLYSVLKYNNRKEQCVRRQLIKISPSQFDFSCRYIRKAQMVDYTISNVQFVNPIKSSTVSEDKKHKKLKKERSHGTSEEKNVITVKPDEPNKDLYLQNDITEEAPKQRDTAVEEKLKNLAFQVSQYQKEQSEHEQAIEQYLKELAVLKSHQDKCPTEKAQKDVAKQQIDLLQQLKKLTPISSVHRKNAISNDRSPINESDEDKKYDCPLLPGQKILALCPYNGWYEEGSIVHDCGDSSYFIQMSHGELSRIWREDLYSDADDYKQDIQERDPVIAPHPVFTEAYCPGVVLKVMTDLKLLIQYYDHTENLVPREQVYSTTQERFERDTANIMACEQRWVGQAVVARDDETGTFHLAEVQKCVGSGRQYVICWMDGTTVIQDIKWIFGRFSKPHVINVGSHVLTLASPSSLTFLPGVIPEITGTKLHVNFCNGQSCENMESHLCFGLSESRFKDAIEYYRQQNRERDAHGEDTVSENEDSHSDISSITITSIDSETESNE